MNMTAAELIQKFNLHYDNILSAAAPGLNPYEISLFFTQAHREIISGIYKGSVGGASIDSEESVKSLITRYIITEDLSVTGAEVSIPFFGNFIQYSFKVPAAVLETLSEYAYKTSDNGNNFCQVKPINLDEWTRLSGNPFRRPSDTRVWRIDRTLINDAASHDRHITLVMNSKERLDHYVITYLKEPEPVVLVNLDEEGSVYKELDLSIMGVKSNNVDGEEGIGEQISPSLWELIINRAVELATRDYKENSLSTQVTMNQRAE